MESETFKNIAQGIQAVAISIAAVASGGWAVFKLYSSRELDKSRTDAVRAKKEFEKRQGLAGQIEIEMGIPLSNGAIPIFLKATIKNESSETHTLDWHNFPLKIASVEKQEDKWYRYQLNPEIRLVCARINSEGSENYWSTTLTTSFMPNTTREMHFYWECPSPGIYLACVSAPLPESLVRYYHVSDEDGTIVRAKEKYQALENFEDLIQFSIEKYFQVPMLEGAKGVSPKGVSNCLRSQG